MLIEEGKGKRHRFEVANPWRNTVNDKHKNCLRIRHIGTDSCRLFTIQRGDFKAWTGDSWSKVLDKAKVFHDHGAAATAVAALQYAQYKGLPVRAFKYIAAALRLDVENNLHGDGPVGGSFVQCDDMDFEDTMSLAVNSFFGKRSPVAARPIGD